MKDCRLQLPATVNSDARQADRASLLASDKHELPVEPSTRKRALTIDQATQATNNTDVCGILSGQASSEEDVIA